MTRGVAPEPLEGVERSEVPAPMRKWAYAVRGRWWRSEGRRRFWLVKGSDPNSKLAEQLGVSERYVAMLLSGERAPSPTMIARIWSVFRIPGELWGLAPDEKGTTCSVTESVADGKVA